MAKACFTVPQELAKCTQGVGKPKVLAWACELLAKCLPKAFLADMSLPSPTGRGDAGHPHCMRPSAGASRGGVIWPWKVCEKSFSLKSALFYVRSYDKMSKHANESVIFPNQSPFLLYDMIKLQVIRVGVNITEKRPCIITNGQAQALLMTKRRHY